MKTFKRSILLALVMAMCVSLFAGCGGEKAPENEPAEETPEYVYTAEYVPIEGEYQNGFSQLFYTDGRFLASSYCKIGERELEEGEVLQWEGQNWIWGNKLFWVGLDGKVEEITGYQPMALPEGFDSETSSVYTTNIMVDKTGNIVTVDNVYTSYYDGPDDIEKYTDAWYEAGYYEYQHDEQHFYVRTLSPDGSEIGCYNLDEISKKVEEQSGYFYINRAVMDDAGNLCFITEMSLYIVSPEGETLGCIESEDYMENLQLLSDGSLVVFCWGENGEEMCAVDTQTMSLGEGVSVSNAYNLMQNLSTEGYDLYYNDGSNLMGVTLATGEKTKVLNWINCDVDSNNSGNGFILPDGRIVTLLSEWNKDYTKCELQFAILQQVPASSVPQKTKLTFACEYMDYQLRSSIIAFNKQNSEYRIEVKDYSEYNTEEDYSAGLTKLTAEIMAGNVPDIIYLSGMPYSKFAAAGLLLDLYPYLDNDPELSREDIMPNILTALEDNGHLYRTASSFEIRAVAGATSVVGEGRGWTLEEYKAALAKMPEGCEPFGAYTTRGEILYAMLQMELDSLIDWNSGKCNFDSADFKNILEFAAQFPEEYASGEGEMWSEADSEYTRIAEGRQMLLSTYLSDFDSYQMYKAMFGGSVNFIGYPVSSGVGNALQLDTGLAISAKCAYPEAAWQFVRTLFTEKYQSESVWSFPTNKTVYDAKLTEAMVQEYQKDANGNFVLDEDGNKIPVSKGSWGWDNFSVEIYALSQEEADEITDIIYNTTRVSDYNAEIMDIIVQDTEAYFVGQKSADEVAKQLQSKLNIYINEQR